MTVTTGDALICAVAKHPEEDTPRLMYADHLDEIGGAANAARAAFIRVQCELARLPPQHKTFGGPHGVVLRARGGPGYFVFSCSEDEGLGPGDRVDLACYRVGKPAVVRHGFKVVKFIGDPDDPDCVVCEDQYSKPWAGSDLKRREQELLARFESEWRRPTCRRCGGDGLVDINEGLREGRCSVCRGTGSCGPLSGHVWIDGGELRDEKGWTHAATWLRGFPVVKCKLEEVGRAESCPHIVGGECGCGGETGVVWTPTPWAVECVRAGASFEVTDAVVHPSGGNATYYPGRLGRFPQEFWGGLQGLPTHAAVVAALNRAALWLVVRAAYPEGKS